MTSLRTRLTLQVTALLGLVGLVGLVVAGVTLDRTSDDLGDARADDLARVVSSGLKAAVDFDDTAAMVQALSRLAPAEGATWAAVELDGNVIVEQAFVAGFAPAGLATLDADDWIVRRQAIEGTTGHVVVLVLSRAEQQRVVARALQAVATLTLLLALAGAGVALLLARRMIAPVIELTEATTLIVETGDLRRAPAVRGDDEVGRLAATFASMIDAQRRALSSLKDAVQELGDAGGRVDAVGDAVRVVTRDVDGRVHDSVEAVNSVRLDVGEAASRVRDLVSRSETGAAALVESANASERAAGSLRELSTQSAAAAAGVDDVVAAVGATADRVVAGEAALRAVAGSMERVGTSAQELEGAATELRGLSARVRDGADAGRELVGSFASGMGAMRASADAVDVRVARLAERMHEIASVVGVINDVAEQTGLLALNASILAAQAKQHGEGFGVVAVSIKELSSRTRTSTGQIATLIGEVIAEAEAAARSARDGGAAVDAGGARALDATRAIETILRDTTAALVRVDAVASLATSQVSELRSADAGLLRALQTLEEMGRAAQRQRNTANALEGTMGRLRDVGGAVNDALAAQRDKARGAGLVMAEMRALIAAVASSQAAQEEALGRLVEQVDAIAAANARQRAPLLSLEETLPALRSGAERLGVESRRFII